MVKGRSAACLNLICGHTLCDSFKLKVRQGCDVYTSFHDNDEIKYMF